MIEGVGTMHRHVKPSQLNPQGGSKDIHIPTPIHKVKRRVNNGKKRSTSSAPRLKALYQDTIANVTSRIKSIILIKCQKLEKVIVSSGTGKKKDDKRHLETVKNTLTKITGQAPVEKLAKKSIAGFKIRAGMGSPVGVMVTLRDGRAY